MGTDIHAVIQVLVQGTWITVVLDPLEGPRSYRTFAFLAGVRNGRGFAGMYTGEPVTPIGELRGLPKDFPVGNDDCHPLPVELQTESRSCYWMGDHSHSYLTLEEMKQYMQQFAITEGLVSVDTYSRWDKQSEPSSHYPTVVGRSYRTMTAEKFEKYLADGSRSYEEDIHIRVKWKYEIEQTYVPRYIEEMENVRLQYDVPAANVRLVFGFDS